MYNSQCGHESWLVWLFDYVDTLSELDPYSDHEISLVTSLDWLLSHSQHKHKLLILISSTALLSLNFLASFPVMFLLLTFRSPLTPPCTV